MAEATRPRVVDLGPYPDDHPIYSEGVSTIWVMSGLTDGQKKRLTAMAPAGVEALDPPQNATPKRKRNRAAKRKSRSAPRSAQGNISPCEHTII